MNNDYLELHCHTNYSFQEGASTVSELLNRAKEIGYKVGKELLKKAGSNFTVQGN